MRAYTPAMSGRTGYALFDSSDALVDANADMFGGEAPSPGARSRAQVSEVVNRALRDFRSFDGRPVEATEAFVLDATRRWRRENATPVEAETIDGGWRLLTNHPRPDGGIALVSIDITQMKRAQLAYQDKAEIFRCITDSHPLPVWVVDEESREILYESLDATHLLGRKYRPRQAQYITDHFVHPDNFEEIRSRLGDGEILRDYEVPLRRANGTEVWCSTNCRRGTYRKRPSLVIGVLDITERKRREDLLGVLIKHHPLPVWMNDASTGEIIYQSSAAERLLGWDKSVRSSPIWLANCFADRDQYLAVGRELMKNGVVENCEARLKRPDGQEFWAIGNLRVVEVHGRRVVLAGIADVTKQKQHDGEVTLAREMLAGAIEALSEGFALYDEDHQLVMCNSLYRKMNPPAEDLPNLDGKQEGGGKTNGTAVKRLLAEHAQGNVELRRHYEADLGNGKWHSVSIHPTDLGGFVVTRADISEQKKAEAVAGEAMALMQKVLDACPSPTRMSTIDGETLYRNPASLELYGDRAEIGDYYVDPEERHTLVDVLLEQGWINDFRVRQYDADDNIFWGSISARLIDFQGRQVIVSNSANITDMLAAQEQSRQANERLTDAIESLAEGFALYDKDDRLVLANSRYRKMHAISADVLVPGVNWFDFLRVTAERNQFPVQPSGIDEWLVERAKDRREFRQQEFRHTDGGWFFVSNCPTREGGFVVTRLDITERKRAELAAKEADELVRRVLEACPASIQMTRVGDGKLLYRSPASVELLGDVTSAFDSYINPAHRREFVERLLREGTVDDFETQLKNRSGEPCWCSISARLIDFHGEQVIVSHTYDLSDRIDMQQELERQRETLHQNEKLSALGGLLAGVAHELNNPLSVVLGMSLTLKETSQDPKTVDRADRIGKAAERCARIVRTFLAMARQQPTRTTNVSIDEVVAAAVEVAGYSIKSSDVQLSVDLAPDLPAIWADPDQLSQVLINLLVNAEHALHGWEGQRKVTVTAGLHEESGNVVIRVSDTGPGIAKDILPRIFEPFFTTKEVGAGTGIGLSFCHRIIQSHGGTIQVETSPGEGTSFIITLPASERRTDIADAAVEEPSVATGRTCLIVDDEEEVGDLIAEVLRLDGYKVVVARSGKEALLQLKKRTFDLILSDLKMPNMDGRRLYNCIYDLYPAEAEKFAFLTGDTIGPDATVFLRATKRPCLEKPIRPSELRAFVSDLINKTT